MLNRSGRTSKVRDLGRFQEIVLVTRPAQSIKRAALRRWPRHRLHRATEVVLLVTLMVVVAWAYLLLLDRLGVAPAALTNFPSLD